MGPTFAGAGDGHHAAAVGLVELQRLVDSMVLQARERGFTASQISHMVTVRLASRRGRRLSIALVGVFGHATEVYARELRGLLADLDPEITAYTIGRLRAREKRSNQVCASDLILTIAHRVKEVQSLLPSQHPSLRGLTFVAHPETISAASGPAGGDRSGDCEHLCRVSADDAAWHQHL